MSLLIATRTDLRVTPLTRAIGATIEGRRPRRSARRRRSSPCCGPLSSATASCSSGTRTSGRRRSQRWAPASGGSPSRRSTPCSGRAGRRRSSRTTSTAPPASFDWHTDLSWTDAPPAFGFLQALEIPPVGGDTIWASLADAFAALSPSRQLRVRASSAAPTPPTRPCSPRWSATTGARSRSDCDVRYPGVSHPLVRRHPETGEPLLFLSPLYLHRLIGVDRRRGERMLRRAGAAPRRSTRTGAMAVAGR